MSYTHLKQDAKEERYETKEKAHGAIENISRTGEASQQATPLD